MPYDENDYDHARLQRQARDVATRAKAHSNSYLHFNEQRTIRRGLFRRQTQWIPSRETVSGWFLLSAADDGEAVCRPSDSTRPGLSGFEHGRVLLLSTDGQLQVAKYAQYFSVTAASRGSVPEGRSESLEDLRVASERDVINFDRLNRGIYRTRNPRRGEIWREELSHNWWLVVPHAGMSASLALKRLKESGSYLQELDCYLTP